MRLSLAFECPQSHLALRDIAMKLSKEGKVEQAKPEWKTIAGSFGNLLRVFFLRCWPMSQRISFIEPRMAVSKAVSYTHLTLPTIYSV